MSIFVLKKFFFFYRDIAKDLGLDPDNYTGHTGCRTSASIYSESPGATVLDLKRFGNWKSDAVAESYIADSFNRKTRDATRMGRYNNSNNSNNNNNNSNNSNDLKEDEILKMASDILNKRQRNGNNCKEDEYNRFEDDNDNDANEFMFGIQSESNKNNGNKRKNEYNDGETVKKRRRVIYEYY